MGTGNVCDKELLTVGSPCIIEVNDVNSPTGIWWGEVVEVRCHDTYLSIIAKITGGRFQLVELGKAVRSDECMGQVPSVNYDVFPDTESIRQLFWRIQRAEAATDQAKRDVAHWRTVHLETMEHLARTLGKSCVPPKTT